MKRIVVRILALLLVLTVVPLALADEIPLEKFKLEFNRHIIYERENNNSIYDAATLKNKETAYGQFEFPDGAPLPDYHDVDFYKITLDRKSHVVIYAESQTGEENVFLTLWKNETEIQSASFSVDMGEGRTAQLLMDTLGTGVYYLMVSEPIDDGKYNGSKYMCYLEARPAEGKVENKPVTSNGDLTNFEKIRKYEYKFYDVSPDDWFAEGVRTAYELGLVNGISSIQFHPDGEITIAETIALACRLHSIYYYGKAEFHQGFTWYQVYVDYALNNGIISAGEYSDYTATATRAQFAAILAKALPKEALLEFNKVKNGAIPDVEKDHPHAEEIYMLYRAGVLVGNDELGSFGPETSIQRSAVATIVTRMAIANERQAITLP